MTCVPLRFESDNLSLAWAEAFLRLMSRGISELIPLWVTVTGFEHGVPVENAEIRIALDKALAEQRKWSVQTVANTIFPISLWNPGRPRTELFTRYKEIFHIVKRCPGNARGVYFQRLIAFGPNEKNQLDHVIQTYLDGNRRRSALQAAIFDPNQDHTNQRQRGFPCLQQVVFTPIGDRGLAVTGLYALQYAFERAYGNFLGLCRLGQFVAHEMGRELTQMNCIATVEKLAVTKTSVESLASRVEAIVAQVTADEDQA